VPIGREEPFDHERREAAEDARLVPPPHDVVRGLRRDIRVVMGVGVGVAVVNAAVIVGRPDHLRGVEASERGQASERGGLRRIEAPRGLARLLPRRIVGQGETCALVQHAPIGDHAQHDLAERATLAGVDGAEEGQAAHSVVGAELDSTPRVGQLREVRQERPVIELGALERP
jgi:hypothetical protein